MSFNAGNSRSLVWKKSRVYDKVRFSMSGIPTILEKPVKSLGKTFNSNLRDIVRSWTLA